MAYVPRSDGKDAGQPGCKESWVLHSLFLLGLLRLVITVRVRYIPRPVGGMVLIFLFFCEKLVGDKVIFYPGYLKREETRQDSAGHICSRLTPLRERT